MTAAPMAQPAPSAALRARILASVPSRVRVRIRLLEAKLTRERFVNAGLRERLRIAEVRHDQTLDELTALVDDQARTIGHAHPAIVGTRAIIGEARVR